MTKHFIALIENSMTLQEVDASGNCMSGQTASFGAALALNTSLHTLSLAWCGLSDAGAASIADGLHCGSQLVFNLLLSLPVCHNFCFFDVGMIFILVIGGIGVVT